MLYDAERHQPLTHTAWNESIVREAIELIVRDCHERFSTESYWPWHPKDLEPSDNSDEPALPLYHGAAGVIWALRYLQDVGAVPIAERYTGHLPRLLERNREWVSALPGNERPSFMLGEPPILSMLHSDRSNHGEQLAELIESNLDHPARELMWGSPGTMLAAWFLYQRTRESRWADLFVRTASRLKSHLEWSQEYGCHFWTQSLYGRESTYLDAIHGFAGTAFVIIQGSALLPSAEWEQWQSIIGTTIKQTAKRENGLANWRPQLTDRTHPVLMQFCHGSPGFVICLAEYPDASMDSLLIEAGDAVWQAGPLAKGSNLCHGTAGNGYAFLKLYQRTGDARWLDRARAFATHAIEQTLADREQYGHLRYSLWTGDPGVAVYLWDCLRAKAEFPTLNVF
jgi:lantibiotic modifying enzyme